MSNCVIDQFCSRTCEYGTNGCTVRHEDPADELERLKAENERLREALYQVSLCGQNSTSSKEECGKIARAALAVKEG